MPQSLLERGANTMLNAGGWNNSPNAVTQTLALADALVISEAFATILTPGLVKSVLSRGAYSRLHAGAFIKYITDVTQTLALADVLPGIAESVSFTLSSIAVRFSHSMLERGSNTILDGGAPQGTHTGGVYKRLVNYPHRKTLIGR